ncbi:hypothetical protein [Streptomyces sp. NPDC001658]
MPGLRTTKAAALGAVVLFAAAMAPASASPSAAPAPVRAVTPAAADPVLVDCFWKPLVRPADFMLACGDGNSRLTSLTWSRWDADAAMARGRNVVNDCEPYCAAGTFHSYPVLVRLDRPGEWTKKPGLPHYTRMTLTYTDTRPERLERVETYPLWD